MAVAVDIGSPYNSGADVFYFIEPSSWLGCPSLGVASCLAWRGVHPCTAAALRTDVHWFTDSLC